MLVAIGAVVEREAVLVAVGCVCELGDVAVSMGAVSVCVATIVVPSAPLSWFASAAVKPKAHRVRVGDHRQHLAVTRARGSFVLWSEVSLINIDCCIALF